MKYTTLTTWYAHGMSSKKIYAARLDPAIAEYGEGLGAIIATHKDASGKEFASKTAIFKVSARVEGGLEMDG